jgi:hypothetical protein
MGAVAAVVALLCVWCSAWGARREATFARARRDFHVQRERLEAKFIRLATANASPEAPRWEDCTFDDDVAYVRSRTTRELSALVAVTVATDAREKAPTGVADVINHLHVGTVMFRFDRDHWETDGRAILNLNPAEAIRLYRDDLEVVDQELARQS